MFRKFTSSSIAANTQAKSSVAKGIRNDVVERYPSLASYVEELVPKKAAVYVARCADFNSAVIVADRIILVSHDGGPWVPTLRLVHQFPDAMQRVQVDKGAIKFILSGSNVMCPGLTSPGAVLPDDIPAGCPVAIYAEGKQHALAIGVTTLSSADIRDQNRGVAIELLHYLNDGLWVHTLPTV